MKSKTRATRFGIAFLVTVIVMISALCVSAFAAEPVEVATEGELWTAIKAVPANTEQTIIVTANITSTASSGDTAGTLTNWSGNTGRKITLKAPEGKTVTITSSFSGGMIFQIKNSCTLILGEGLVLDGNNVSRHVYVNNGATLILDGATLKNGNGSAGSITGAAGAKIYIESGLIDNCTSTGSGGAISLGSSSTAISEFKMSGGTISNCTATTHSGAIALTGGYTKVWMTGGTITGNTAGTYAGAFYLYANFQEPMTNMIITDNTANGTYTKKKENGENDGDQNAAGGAFFIDFSKSITLGEGTVISGNKATAGRGGAIATRNPNAKFTIDGAQILDNEATVGGGVYISSGTLTLKSGKISGNKATNQGGGVCLGYSTSTSFFNMDGGELSGNTAGTFGGGVCSSYGTVTVTGGLIEENYAERFGGGLAGVAVGTTRTDKATANAVITVTGGSVIGNKTGEQGDGAGFGFYASTQESPYFIANCTISGNISGKNGGAICVNATSTNLTPVVVTTCTISENYANGYGGVAYSNGDLSIAETEIYDNKSKSLIFDIAGSGYGGQLYMKNVTAYGNASNVLRDAESGEYSFKDSRTSAGSVLYCEGTTETTVEDCVFYGNEGASAVQASGSASVKFVGNTEVYDNILNGKYDDALCYYVFDTENTKCQYRDVTLANGELLFDLGSEANIKIPQTDFRLSEDGIFKIGTIFDGNDEISGISSSADAELGAVLDTDGVTVIWDNSTLVALTLDSPNSAYSTTLFAPYADVSYQLPKQSEIKSLFDADDLVFVGYADVTNYGTAPTLVGLYDEDATFTADQLNGEKLYATWTDLKTVDGDSVRVGEDTSKIGLRFFATIDAEPLKAIGIENTNKGIGFGLGMRVYYKDSENNLTSKDFVGYDKDLDEDWAGEQYFEELGGLKAYAFGLNLSEAEYEYDFTPVAFIKVTYGEKEGSTVSSKSAYSKSTEANDVKGYDYKSARQTAIEWVETLTDEKWDAMSEKQFANLKKVVGEGYETFTTAGGKNKLVVKPE